MDKRVILILVVVIVVVALVGGVLVFLNSKPATTVITPTPTPTSAPVISTQTQPSLSAKSAAPFVVGQPGTIDIYADTKSVQIDGFQFIATIAGSSLPTIPDSDATTDGVQIQAATIPELSVSTNSVTAQEGTFVIRFAMIAQGSTKGFSSTGPVKIASIPISIGTGGSVTLAFNQQNSRVRLSSGGDDALMGVADVSIPVESMTAAVASPSVIASTATTTTPKTAAAGGTSTSPFCLASCFTDSDCAAGFACETDRCVNPACPTSQTCGCGTTQTATPVATTRPVVTSSATPKPTATPRPTSVASASAQLPASGSFEYTLLTLGAGLLLLGGGVFMTARAEA